MTTDAFCTAKSAIDKLAALMDVKCDGSTADSKLREGIPQKPELASPSNLLLVPPPPQVAKKEPETVKGVQ